jgi:drug/metabolite transporter (DMT)-like permease
MRVGLVWWTACLLWSSTFLFIKLGLRDIPPLTFASLRLALAVAILAPWMLASGSWRRLRRQDLVALGLTGVLLLGVNYALIFWGAQHIASGLVAILQSATPVIALALGASLGLERVTPRKILGLLAGVGGVVLVVGADTVRAGGMTLGGSAAVLASSACVAFGYVWVDAIGSALPRITIVTLQSIAGLVPLAVAAAVIEGVPAPARWPATAWVSLVYLGIAASVVAFSLNYWLLRRMPASAMLMMGVAEVPIAVALGAVVFGERLPPGTLAGAAVVLLGVVLVLKASERKEAP